MGASSVGYRFSKLRRFGDEEALMAQESSQSDAAAKGTPTP